MKVLFLDIDGVTNSYDNIYVRTALWKCKLGKSMDKYGHLFDERCVRWLEWIDNENSKRNNQNIKY